MFTIKQIEEAHSKVKSGAEFPNYIQDIKEIGVVAFETWVKDSHTTYFGKDIFRQHQILNMQNCLFQIIVAKINLLNI